MAYVSWKVYLSYDAPYPLYSGRAFRRLTPLLRMVTSCYGGECPMGIMLKNSLTYIKLMYYNCIMIVKRLLNKN